MSEAGNVSRPTVSSESGSQLETIQRAALPENMDHINSSQEEGQENSSGDNEMPDLHMEVTEEASTLNDEDDISCSDNENVNTKNEEGNVRNTTENVEPLMSNNIGQCNSLNGMPGKLAEGNWLDITPYIKREAIEEEDEDTEVEDWDDETDRLPTSTELQQQLLCVLSSVEASMLDAKEEPPEAPHEEKVQQPMFPKPPPSAISIQQFLRRSGPSPPTLRSATQSSTKSSTTAKDRSNLKRKDCVPYRRKKRKVPLRITLSCPQVCLVCNAVCTIQRNKTIPTLQVCRRCKNSYYYYQRLYRQHWLRKCPGNGNCVIDYKVRACQTCHFKKYKEVMKAQALKDQQTTDDMEVNQTTGNQHPMRTRTKQPANLGEVSRPESSTDSASESRDEYSEEPTSTDNQFSVLTTDVHSPNHTSPISYLPNAQQLGTAPSEPNASPTPTTTAAAQAYPTMTNGTALSSNNMRVFIHTCEHLCSQCSGAQAGPGNTNSNARQSSHRNSPLKSSGKSNTSSAAESDESLRVLILTKLTEIAQFLQSQVNDHQPAHPPLPPEPNPTASVHPTSGVHFLNSKTVIDLNPSKGQIQNTSSAALVTCHSNIPNLPLLAGMSTVDTHSLSQLPTATVTATSTQSMFKSVPDGLGLQTGILPVPHVSSVGSHNFTPGPPTMLAVTPRGFLGPPRIAVSLCPSTRISFQPSAPAIPPPVVVVPRFLVLHNPNK